MLLAHANLDRLFGAFVEGALIQSKKRAPWPLSAKSRVKISCHCFAIKVHEKVLRAQAFMLCRWPSQSLPIGALSLTVELRQCEHTGSAVQCTAIISHAISAILNGRSH